MTKSQRLKVDLDRPENGWLIVELASGDQQYSFHPSYIPYDSITELVNALLKTLDGYDKAIVRWNDEPVEHEFAFEPKGDQVDFRAYIINEMVFGKEQEQVFEFSGTTYEVVWPFWKALRDMESRQSRREYEKQWREPFPERGMVELTRRIKEMKSQIDKSNIEKPILNDGESIMANSNVTVDRRDGLAVVYIKGNIDNPDGQEIARATYSLIDEGYRVVLFNLTETKTVNSTGISVLIEIIEKMVEIQARLGFCCLSPTLEKTFQIMGLAQYAPIFPSEAAAVAGLRN